MRNLEFKDIYRYLPFNLEGIHHINNDVMTIHLFTEEISQNSISLLGFFNECTPILYPHDLTKEIEYNGEKFLPTVWFRDNYYLFGIQKDDMLQLISMYLYVFNRNDSAPDWFTSKLYEWKIDVNGLITQGLAIDKNTL